MQYRVKMLAAISSKGCGQEADAESIKSIKTFTQALKRNKLFKDDLLPFH